MEQHTWIMSNISYLITTIVLLILLVEQLLYLRKKRFLPGPTLVPPFIGNALSMVTSPTRFWDQQSAYAKSTPLGISSNYLFGRHILYIHSADLSHKIFANVRPDAFHLIGHPFGKKLFGSHNLIYMFGQPHKDLRRRIAPNFTPAALHTYTQIQHPIILRHLSAWCGKGKKPFPLRLLCRDMNLETSQTVFVGPYLDGPARADFNKDYNLFNVGLMKLPIDFPGFAFREARLAVGRLVRTLSRCAAESERRMRSGEEEPTCLIDFWMLESLNEINVINHDEIGGHLFDFLFASQDASTSSLLWAVVFLDKHPEVVERVRDEVARLGGDDVENLNLREMRYTEAVAREVVRIRAPATMVPHVAGVDFELTEGYTVPKGTIVFPSVYDACLEGFKEAERFDPERFMEGREEGRVYGRNYLAFGAGAHQCVGQRYAINHLKLFIAMWVGLVDCERERTEGCDEIEYVPTIVPRDDCRVWLKPRRRFGSLS